MENLKIGDKLFHPCNMDIISHKVIGILQFENFRHYACKAIYNVGACGKIEVLVDEHNGKFRFVELKDEENIEYASGLQDFIEGNYYRTYEEAQIEFYNQQVTLAWTNMEQKERFYKEAKARHEQVKLLVRNLKESKNV